MHQHRLLTPEAPNCQSQHGLHSHLQQLAATAGVWWAGRCRPASPTARRGRDSGTPPPMPRFGGPLRSAWPPSKHMLFPHPLWMGPAALSVAGQPSTELLSSRIPGKHVVLSHQVCTDLARQRSMALKQSLTADEAWLTSPTCVEGQELLPAAPHPDVMESPRNCILLPLASDPGTKGSTKLHSPRAANEIQECCRGSAARPARPGLPTESMRTLKSSPQ